MWWRMRTTRPHADSHSGEGGAGRDIEAGRRARSQDLPVQRRAAPGAAGPAVAAAPPIAAGVDVDVARPAVAVDDPFALHLGGPVQRKGGGGDSDVLAAAARGVAGPGEAMPHHDVIQRSFGPAHDVGAIRAHTDGAARQATADMGALGFATGRDVAFAGAPDLHTAAHEAAHVFQQQAGVQLAGGVGEDGDVHERHADAVADRVVAGASAADLLPAVGAGAGAVQRKAHVDPAAASGAHDAAHDGDEAAEEQTEEDEAAAREADQSEDSTPGPAPLAAGKPPGAVQKKAAGAARPRAGAANATTSRARRTTIAEAVVRYAPLVFLHPDEKHGPADAGQYVAQSELGWSHDQGRNDHTIADRGEIDQAKLGSGGYSHQVEGANPFGDHHGDAIHSNEDVRPNDGKGAGGNEGFFLDPGDKVKDPAAPNTRAPVYHEAKDGHYITYWFFYAYNSGPTDTKLDNHQADWERIVVKLDRQNRATHVCYYQHEHNETLKWASVPKSGSHPIVFSAKGGHASYSKPGRFATEIKQIKDEAKRGGKQWKTWNNLKDARAQDWYGYGGAWGEVGQFTHTTGPQGPSSHKPPAPAGW